MPTNVIYDFHDETVHYDELMDKALLTVEKAMMQNHLRLMVEESMYGVSLSSSMILKEGARDFAADVAEFFKSLWTLFVNKVKEIAQDNETWLKAHEKDIANIDYANLSITTFPYWMIGRNDYMKIYNDFRNNANRVLNLLKSTPPEKIMVTDDIKAIKEDEELFRRVIADKYVDSEGSVDKGIYNYLRTKDPNKLETVTITGDELKEKVAAMVAFMKRYKNMAADLNSLKTQMENELKKVNRVLGPLLEKSAKESYSLTLEAVEILFEEADAGNKGNYTAKKEPTAADKAADAAKKENGTVEKKSEHTADKDASITGKEEDYKQMDKIALAARQYIFKLLQKLFTSILTAAEEKNSKYKKIVRSLVASSKGTTKKDSSDEGEKKEENKDTKEKKSTKESYEDPLADINVESFFMFSKHTKGVVSSYGDAIQTKALEDMKRGMKAIKLSLMTLSKNKTSNLVSKVKSMRNSTFLPKYVYNGFHTKSLEARFIEKVVMYDWNIEARKFEKLIDENILIPFTRAVGSRRLAEEFLTSVGEAKFTKTMKFIDGEGVKLLGGLNRRFRLKNERWDDAFLRLCDFDTKPIPIVGFNKGPSLDFFIDRVDNADLYFDAELELDDIINRFGSYGKKVSQLDVTISKLGLNTKLKEVTDSILEFVMSRLQAILDESIDMYKAYPKFNIWELNTCINLLKDLEEALLFGRQDKYYTITPGTITQNEYTISSV